MTVLIDATKSTNPVPGPVPPKEPKPSLWKRIRAFLSKILDTFKKNG